MISQAKMEQTRTGIKLSFLASSDAEGRTFVDHMQKRIDDEVRSRVSASFDDVEVAKLGPTPRGLLGGALGDPHYATEALKVADAEAQRRAGLMRSPNNFADAQQKFVELWCSDLEQNPMPVEPVA